MQRKIGLFLEASRSVHNPSHFYEGNAIYAKFSRNFQQIKVFILKKIKKMAGK
jgi:hypothetical protein